MQPKKEDPVTSRFKRPDQEVPILMPSGEGRPDGTASFLPSGLGQVGLRVLRRGDFTKALYWELSKRAQRQLGELIALRQGITKEGPSYWLAHFLGGKRREEKFGRKVSAALHSDIRKYGRPSERTELMIGRGRLFGDPLTRLSVAVTKKLSRARLVLWWTGLSRRTLDTLENPRELSNRVAHLIYFRGKDYVPAVFAPDLETAFYVYTLFNFTGRGLGTCPFCSEVFQRTREDQLYCCQSHADAFRLQRWRKEKREEARKGKTE